MGLGENLERPIHTLQSLDNVDLILELYTLKKLFKKEVLSNFVLSRTT